MPWPGRQPFDVLRPILAGTEAGRRELLDLIAERFAGADDGEDDDGSLLVLDQIIHVRDQRREHPQPWLDIVNSLVVNYAASVWGDISTQDT